MDKEIKKTINTYNKIAEQYYKKTKNLAIGIKLLYQFAKLLPANAKILDVGCGPGRDAKLFTDKGFKVIGIDLAKKMIEFAKKIAPKAKFKIMDFRELTFKNNNFNAIWFNASLLNIKKKDTEKTLNEMYRVLKSNGLIFVSVKQGKGEGLEKDKRYNGIEKYYAYYDRDELKRKLEEAGFKIIKIETGSKKERYDTHQFIRAYCKKQ